MHRQVRASIRTTGAFSWTPTETDGGNDFTITVRVTDDGTPVLDDSETLAITVNNINQAPIADAGPDQTVFTVDTVQLDGSGSSDLDGDTLTYLWSVSATTGGTITISDVNAESPTVNFGQGGTFTLQLEVSDGTDTDTDTVTIVVNDVPLISVLDATISVPEGNTGTTTVTIDVTISEAINRVVTVDYTTVDVTAFVGDNDYVAANDVVTFPANSTATQSIDVFVNGDSTIEPDEVFRVDLSNSTNATVSLGSSVVTIVNDDALPSLTIVASDANAAEAGPDTGTFTLTRTGPTDEQLIVVVSLGGTAVELSDYASIQPGNVFQIGQSSIDITVTPIADNLVEGDETVVLSIDPSANYTVGTPGSATVTIADDPAIVTATVIDADADESGPDSGTIRLARSGGNLTGMLNIQITMSGAASNGQDYGPFGGGFAIPVNQTTFDVVLTPDADNLVEGTEDAILTIDASANYTIGTPGAATINIVDDPVIATIVATDPSASEIGPDSGEFTVTRTGGDLSSAIPILSAISGTATEFSDYGNIQPNLLIPANQASATITINPITDSNPEGSETVILTIDDSGTNSYIAGAPSTATVTIAENSPPNAIDDPTSTDEDTAAIFDVLANDKRSGWRYVEYQRCNTAGKWHRCQQRRQPHLYTERRLQRC